MSNEELQYSIKQNDMEDFKELYEKYKQQVYCTVYSVFKDKATAAALLTRIFVKSYREVKNSRQGVDFEDRLYSITADVVRDYRNKTNQSKETSCDDVLVGFISDFPFKLKGDKLTDQEYSDLFEEIAGEIARFNNKKSQLGSRITSCLTHKKLAPLLGIALLLVLLIYNFRNGSLGTLGMRKDNESKPSTIIANREITDYDKGDRIATWYGASLYTEAHENSKVLGQLKGNAVLKVQQAVRNIGYNIWLQVTVTDDELGEVTGWVKEVDTLTRLAASLRVSKAVEEGELRVLVDNYLSSLCGEAIPEEHRIIEYSIQDVSVIDMWHMYGGDYSGRLFIEFYCDIKPVNDKVFELSKTGSADENGYLQGLHLSGQVELYSDAYVLIGIGEGYAYESNKEIRNFIKEKGFLPLKSRSGTEHISLPDIYKKTSGADEVLRLYLAYCNELSKSQGYNFFGYTASDINFSRVSVVKNGSFMEHYELIVLEEENNIIGVWLEQHNIHTKEVRYLALDGRNFASIIKDKEQWLSKYNFENYLGNFERMLTLSTVYLKKPLISTLTQQLKHEISFDKAVDMAVNTDSDMGLIKQEIIIIEDKDMEINKVAEHAFERFLLQFQNDRLSRYTYFDEYRIDSIQIIGEEENEFNFYAAFSIRAEETEHIIFGSVYMGEEGWIGSFPVHFTITKLESGYKLYVYDQL
jgi:DNA-directed RNA polymerase specialized sigma24 family protein